jgi:site-specific DNA-methyltransferase (adenine-specific)
MKVINGNNIEVLKQYPDNYFDAIVTDPPYGLGKEPNAEELMKDWIEKGYHEISGTGFMGKEWDAFIPQPLFWKEAFRVLKHGGHVVSFFGSRTYDWGVMSMRFAGFEVRDCIQWLYGSGFPKSHNISKAIDKMYGAEREVIGEKKSIDGRLLSSRVPNAINKYQGGFNTYSDLIYNTNITISSTEQAKQWDGWGSALKPANEPIVLARKPLEKGLTIAENVLKWGTGAINIDGCRVAIDENDKNQRPNGSISLQDGGKTSIFNIGGRNESIGGNTLDMNKGRFPANIILTHHEDCECIGTKKVKGTSGYETDGEDRETKFGQVKSNKITTHYGSEETVEDWTCHEDCPIKILDEQSGVLKSGQLKSDSYTKDRENHSIFAGGSKFTHKGYSANIGGASRFFYVAKASKSERNKGLDGFEEKALAFSNQAKAELKRGNENFDGGDAKGHGNSIRHLKNFHPTVKPIKLMQYLVRLITPPNGIVLDPFCGSGTTGVACKLEGVQFVGLEQDAEYCKIAQARIDNYTEELPKKPKSPEKNTDEQLNIFEL